MLFMWFYLYLSNNFSIYLIFYVMLYLFYFIMDFKNILRFICRFECFLQPHTQKNYRRCLKGCGWLCNPCNRNSIYLLYIYIGATNLCLYHYLRHARFGIHTIQNNTVILYNPQTNLKNTIPITMPINTQICSIMLDNKIFIIGGTDEVYEINCNTKKWRN